MIKLGIYRNKKKGTLYLVTRTSINCTNAQDGQTMAIYTNGTEYFCREINEFLEKFEPERVIKNES
jgi:hypothetical protein